MANSLSGRALLAIILAASIASTIGGLPFNSLPVVLGSMADTFGLPPDTIGMMGSVCFTGYLAGTLGAPFWINRIDWRTLTIVSAGATASAFALSATVVRVDILYLLWALIGFFASTMTCLGMRILSDQPDKVRALGVRLGVELSITAAVLFALPPLLIASWRYTGAALGLAGVVLLLAVSALWLPRGPRGVPASNAAPGAALPMASWASLAVFFLFLVGNVGLWAFLERIGAASQVAPAGMGMVFAVLKLLGGVAGFAVAFAGERLGRRLPFLLVLAGSTAGLALLASGGGLVTFALGAWTWEFFFTCGCVFQTAAIAHTDRSGRAIVLVPAAFALGSMVGPGLAGYLLADAGIAAVLGLAFASSLAPVLATAWRRSSRAIAA
ncbi:MFS transporter [Massilia cavernae]|uniref:MFS transporter n=1 Tax=Massilia cavernae TaxID=2320864 RepID=A0A418Y0U6_9BURK|nr:MFS transporter [Massilia cavernae]RJG18997.1 MFS transporter [Massilia cavernae]